MDLVVLDVSRYQTIESWAKVKAAGIVGVIHKATEATSYVDPTFITNAKGALAAGLKVGAYHFLRPGRIVEQMQHFVSTVDKALLPGSRIVIDWEDGGNSMADAEKAAQWLKDNRPDFQVAVYASSSFLQEKIGSSTSAILSGTSLWAARYSSQQPYFPTQVWPAWSLWQYTDKATVAGINGPVDGNKWNGSTENLLKWFGPTNEVPDTTSEVAININGPVKVSVSRDGKIIFEG